MIFQGGFPLAPLSRGQMTLAKHRFSVSHVYAFLSKSDISSDLFNTFPNHLCTLLNIRH